MKPDIICSLLAGFLSLVAYVGYNWQILTGNASPNTTSWAIWSFMTVLNFASYKEMTKDGWKSFLPTFNSSLCILTFFISLVKGQLQNVVQTDILALALGIVASIIWKKSRSPVLPNMMLQLGIIVGFIPTVRGVLVAPQDEVAICWFLWAISFAFQLAVVVMRWKGQKQDLVYPINCFVLHLAVGLLALRGQLEIIGIISGLLVIISIVPYTIRVWQGKIRPNITSWSLWSAIGFTILITYRDSGAEDNVWPAIFGFSNPLIVTILAIIRRGEKTAFGKIEWACAVTCIITLLVWGNVRSNPDHVQYALYLALLADLLAGIPTFVFVSKHPDQDRPFAWGMFGFAYILALGAIPEHSVANYVLPVYMFLGSMYISYQLTKYRIRSRSPINEWI